MAPRPLPPPALRALLRRRGATLERLEPLHGDVSARRYLRLQLAGEPTRVAALYPPELRGACRRFVASGALLSAAGVPVPRILESACEEGVMLLEDLGGDTLYDLRDRPTNELRPYLERAIELQTRIAGLHPAAVAGLGNPPLDEALLGREVAATRQDLLAPSGLLADGRLAEELDEALATICRRLGQGPLVPCHRDFMARNLVPRGTDGELAVLDHQDLRLGPAAYDLASLLNDSLFAPRGLEEALLARALPRLGIERPAYHAAAVQRCLKAAGTLAGPHATRHRGLVAPSLERALDHLGRLEPWRELAGRLREAWASRLRR